MQRTISLSLSAIVLMLSAAACESSVVVRPCADGDCGGNGEGAGDACGPGTKLCDGECTNVANDPDHCGACGNDCTAGGFCVSGACQHDCPLETCGDFCVDTKSDPKHCGFCFNACDAGEACSQGSCDSACPPNTLECGGACVDILSDPNHCGGCFSPCNGFCVDGFCQSSCGPGLIECNGFCVDPATDHQHCGGCFSPCGDEETCEMGTCTTGVCPGAVCGICDTAFIPNQVPLSVVGSTVGAQHHYTPSCVGTAVPEVLHEYTAPATGLYTFDTVGSTYDTVLSLLGPNGCFETACDDDTIGLASQVQTLLVEGDTIFVVVDGFEPGTYQLNVSIEPNCGPGEQVCNGDCVDIITDPQHCGFCNNPCGFDESCVTGLCVPECSGPCGLCGTPVGLGSTVPQTTNGNTSGGPDHLLPSCTGQSAPENYYAFTAPSTGSYVFSTANSSFDTVRTVFDSASCGELGCNDNFGAQITSRVQTTLTMGQTVYVVVDGKNTSGAYSLFINGTPASSCPTNDLGDVVPVTISGTTVGASNNFVPSCAGGSTAPEHTFTFTAPVTKVYEMTTVGSTFDTVLYVLGATCSGASLACDDDTFGTQSQIFVNLAAGQTVTVVVDGWGMHSGSYVLNID